MKLSSLCGPAALALILAGCGDQDAATGNAADSGVTAAGDQANALIANLSASAGQDDPARLQALVAQAMPAAISDAKDALYRNVRGGAGGAVCGEVAEKPAGRAAPVFRPFIVNPDGIAVVSPTPKLALTDPNDFVADAWIRWCASPEELQKLAPQLHKAGASPSTPANSAEAFAPSPAPDLPPPPPPTPPQPPAKPPSTSVDSFFNSVQHSPR
jgi:hypothetical protein